MIFKMSEDDLDKVLELEKVLFSDPWTYENYLYELNDNPYSNLYIIKNDQDIIGYAGLWVLFEQGQITTIGINPKYQKQGYGKILLEYLINQAKAKEAETISLEVRVSNDTAIALYEKYGFITINIRKAYYQDNYEDAYLMMKGI